MPPPTSLGSAAGRVAKDKVSGCLTTVAFIAVGAGVYLFVPEAQERYFGLICGLVYAAIGGLFAWRGVLVSFGLPFLPLWLIGLAMAAVGCWHAWGKWGLFGAIPIGVVALVLVVVRVAAVVRAEDRSGTGAGTGTGTGPRDSKQL